jgi:GDP-mannose pyrophosphatase NudK
VRTLIGAFSLGSASGCAREGPPSGDFAVTDFLKPIKTTTLSDTWGLLQRHEFDLRRRDGSWQRQIRETYDRGDGAAVLLCNLSDGSVILTRQFRYPAIYRGEQPYLIEVCAGKLEGDDAETCARKEALEETGYEVGRLEKAFDCFMSPGSVTERLTLFLGFIEGGAESSGGGLRDEGEDIEVVRMPFSEAMRQVAAGEIADAKTVMLLQYAALNQVFG